jgi:hypothetical protein
MDMLFKYEDLKAVLLISFRFDRIGSNEVKKIFRRNKRKLKMSPSGHLSL